MTELVVRPSIESLANEKFDEWVVVNPASVVGHPANNVWWFSDKKEAKEFSRVLLQSGVAFSDIFFEGKSLALLT